MQLLGRIVDGGNQATLSFCNLEKAATSGIFELPLIVSVGLYLPFARGVRPLAAYQSPGVFRCCPLPYRDSGLVQYLIYDVLQLRSIRGF